MHHASTGNLDRRGAGDVTTLTLAEYRALPFRRRMAYRLYRHPLVMFGVGPAWLILLRLRIPRGSPWRRWRDWLSIVGTDAALAALVAALMIIWGPIPVLLGWLPVMLLAATIGVWLFYVQHQFEDAYWEAASALGFSRGRTERVFVLRPAARAALGDRQYRVPSRSSPRQPDSELSAAGMPRGASGTPGSPEADAAGKPAMRTAGAVGCRSAEAGAVQPLATDRAVNALSRSDPDR